MAGQSQRTLRRARGQNGPPEMRLLGDWRDTNGLVPRHLMGCCCCLWPAASERPVPFRISGTRFILCDVVAPAILVLFLLLHRLTFFSHATSSPGQKSNKMDTTFGGFFRQVTGVPDPKNSHDRQLTSNQHSHGRVAFNFFLCNSGKFFSATSSGIHKHVETSIVFFFLLS